RYSRGSTGSSHRERIEGCEHGQILRYVPGTPNGEHNEPDEGDWSEERGDPCRAPGLHRKQGEQDEDGQRNHKALESRRYHLKSFNRRQYRQRWRDHRIAIKQRGADHAEQDDGEAFSSEREMSESDQG